MSNVSSTNESGRPGERDEYESYRFVEAPDVLGADQSALLFARRYLLPVLGPVADRPILEVGAGRGGTLRALAALGVRGARGVDVSPAQVDAALRAGSSVALREGLESLLGERSGSLGAVVMLDVLEHLEAPAVHEWLAAASAALQPGGVLVFRVPNGEGLFAGSIRYGDFTHRQAFTARSVRQILGPAGFSKIEVSPCRPVVHGVASALRWVAWRLVEAAAQVAFFAESGRRDVLLTRNLLAVGRKPQ